MNAAGDTMCISGFLFTPFPFTSLDDCCIISIDVEVIRVSDSTHRCTITMDSDTFRRVEDVRFLNRYQSRNDAMVDIIKKGLDALEASRSSQKVTLSEQE